MKVVMTELPNLPLGVSGTPKIIESSQLSVKDTERLLRQNSSFMVISCKEDIDQLLYERFQFPSTLNKVLWSDYISENLNEVLVPGFNENGEFKTLNVDEFSFNNSMKPKHFCFMHLKFI